MLVGLENFLEEPLLDRMYFGIHTGGMGKKRKFYENIVFEDPIVAQMFFDMEIFSLPINTLPEKYRITEVFHWEIEQQSLKLYNFPKTVKIMFGDSFFFNSMIVSMELKEDNFPEIFYASTWCIFASSDWREDEETQTNDTQVFGVRLRPGNTAPNRKNFISMRGEGLPGLWYITIGQKREVDVFPVFDNDNVNPCAICPNRPFPRSK